MSRISTISRLRVGGLEGDEGLSDAPGERVLAQAADDDCDSTAGMAL